MLGNGDGTFRPPLTYAAGNQADFVAVGDFNGDGKPDLAVAHSCCEAGGNVSILLGNGDGTFQPQVTYSAGGYPTALAIGDSNGDGKLDLAVANGEDYSVSILLGNGDGTFQRQVTYPAGRYPTSVAVRDFNGDGKLVLLGNGDGTFQYPMGFSTDYNPVGVAVGDFNLDGKPDLAVGTDYSVSLLTNTTPAAPE